MGFAASLISLCSLAFVDASTAFEQCVKSSGQAYIQARDDFLTAPDRELLRRKTESDQWRNHLTAVTLNAWLSNHDYYRALANDGLRDENIKPEARFFAYEILLKSEDRRAVGSALAAIDSWVRQGIPIHSEYFLDAVRDSESSPMHRAMAAKVLSMLPPSEQGVTIEDLVKLELASRLRMFDVQIKLEPKTLAFMDAIKNQLPQEQIAALGEEIQNSAESKDAEWARETTQAMSNAIYKRRNTLSEKRKVDLIEGYSKLMAKHGERGTRSAVEFAQLLGGSRAKLVTAKRLTFILKNMPNEVKPTQDPTPEEFTQMITSESGRMEILFEASQLIDSLKDLEASEYLAAFSRSQLGDSSQLQTAMRYLTDLPFTEDSLSALLMVARDTKRETNERYYALVMLGSLVRKTTKDENQPQIHEKILNGFHVLQNEGLGDAILEKEVDRSVEELQKKCRTKMNSQSSGSRNLRKT